MDNFLNSLPRAVLVAGALMIGLVFLLLTNPPHTACDSQYEIFKDAQTPFLYKDPKKKFMDETALQSSMNVCQVRPMPGTCYQFFDGLKNLINDVKTVSRECRSEVLAKPEISNALFDSLSLIFNLAWGEKPPESYLDKMGWLDTVHKSTFCEIQMIVKENFTESRWTQFREATLANLPGASLLDRKEVWNRSLFTLKCP